MRPWSNRVSRFVVRQVRGWHVSLVLAVVCAVALVLAFTAHAAPTPTTPITYYACVNLDKGTIHMTTATGTCDTTEQLINWNQVGPQGPQGPAGPQGPQGPAGGVGFHGVKLYKSSDSWTAPAGVMGVLVEAWGAGGGGGQELTGSYYFTYTCSQNGFPATCSETDPVYYCGGGGGGGGYVRGVAAVTPGQTYQVVVGAGGAGWAGAANATAGGASGLSSSGTLLIGADGGQPGTNAKPQSAPTVKDGVPGTGGAGGQGNPNGGILFAGSNGQDGAGGSNGSPNGACGGAGGSVGFAGSVPVPFGAGGGTTSGGGGSGNGGGVLLTW